MNDKVLASWSDCRFYPAKVIAVNRDGETCNISWMFCVFTLAKVMGQLVVTFQQYTIKNTTDFNDILRKCC